MPTHYFGQLTPDEVTVIHQHWLDHLNPKKLRGQKAWVNTKHGEDVNRVGLLSECVANKYWNHIPIEVTLESRPEIKNQHWSADEGFDINLGGFKLDVKCQISKYNPHSNWLWNVAEKTAISPNKECSGYLWVYKKLGDDYTFEFIGWMFRTDFLEQSSKHLKGEPKGKNGFYLLDTYDITEDHMMDIGELRRSMF